MGYMISIEEIKKDFKYIEDRENGDFYAGSWSTTRQNSKFELYFNAKFKEIEQTQIENFELFMKNQAEIATEIESIIKSKISENPTKDSDKVLNGILEFDIVSVLQSGGEYDIELICSKNYETFLLKKRVDYVVAIRKGKIKEFLDMN